MLKSVTLAFSILFASSMALTNLAQAQSAPAQSAPAGQTFVCKDNTTWTGKSKKGACSHHGGVAKDQTHAAPATNPSAAPAPTASKSAASAAAPGGGAGQVWVNTASKVYHCSGDRYYGKTKKGSYMSESAAVAAGDRPSGGKSCHK